MQHDIIPGPSPRIIRNETRKGQGSWLKNKLVLHLSFSEGNNLIPNTIFNDRTRYTECSIMFTPYARADNFFQYIPYGPTPSSTVNALANKFHTAASNAELAEYFCPTVVRDTQAKISLYTSKPSPTL